MKKLLTILFLFLTFCIPGLFGQDITKVTINFAHDTERNFSGYNLSSDTVNQYILLGNDFKNDLVAIYISDSIFYRKIIHTDYNNGYAEYIKLPNHGRISIQINSMPKLELVRLKEKNYYNISFARREKEIVVEYSKYCPYIY